MSFIKKRKVKGKIYYALVEKVKRPDGSWGLKQLASYGTKNPTPKVNRVTEQVPQSNKPIISLVPKQEPQLCGIWSPLVVDKWNRGEYDK